MDHVQLSAAVARVRRGFGLRDNRTIARETGLQKFLGAENAPDKARTALAAAIRSLTFRSRQILEISFNTAGANSKLAERREDYLESGDKLVNSETSLKRAEGAAMNELIATLWASRSRPTYALRELIRSEVHVHQDMSIWRLEDQETGRYLNVDQQGLSLKVSVRSAHAGDSIDMWLTSGVVQEIWIQCDRSLLRSRTHLDVTTIDIEAPGCTVSFSHEPTAELVPVSNRLRWDVGNDTVCLSISVVE